MSYTGLSNRWAGARGGWSIDQGDALHANSDPRDPPFDPAAIQGEGWRLVLEPLRLQLRSNAPSGDAIVDRLTPPRTLAARVVLPMRGLSDAQKDAIRALRWDADGRLVRFIGFATRRARIPSREMPQNADAIRDFVVIPPQYAEAIDEVLAETPDE